MEIKLKKLNKNTKIPSYAHPGDAGLDLYSLEDYNLKAGEMHVFWLGFAIEIPDGFVAQVFDKSSLAVKHKIHTIGGVFDSGYRGEYSVNLINLSKKTYKIEKGDKIAQLIIYPVAQVNFCLTNKLSDSQRGTGKLGSSGRK